MNVSPLTNQVQSADVPLERLAGNASLSDEQKVGEATRQFEALLLRKILAESQKTVFKSKLSDDSTAASIYRDMVTNQLAESISKSGALGLSQTLEQQLNRQTAPAALAGHDHAHALPTATAATDAARPSHSRRPVAHILRADRAAFEHINAAD